MRVLVMSGEGIGPEITAPAVDVLRAVSGLLPVRVTVEEFEVGEAARARTGRALPAAAEAACRHADAEGGGVILFGSVSDEPIGILRKTFDLYANLRPVRVEPALVAVSPLRDEAVGQLDMLIVRELASGLYYGRRRSGRGRASRWAGQEMYYRADEVERIARVAFAHARVRRRRLTLVHKANAVPDVFALWLSAVRALAAEFPEVTVEELLADNMAMQMVLRPASFDVVLACNTFGDLLSDLAAGLVGSIGLLPSMSVNERGFALYEPICGTAPDIAGRDVANPVGSILCVALMCRHSLGSAEAGRLIEAAVGGVLEHARTPDVWRPGCDLVSTTEMGRRVLERLATVCAHAPKG